MTNQHHAALEAARIERLSLEDRATRCSQILSKHSQRISRKKTQERDVINQIRTLQYNGPAPPTDDGITSLQHQIKHSIVQVKAEQKELHSNIDVLKGKWCAVQNTLDEFIEAHIS